VLIKPEFTLAEAFDTVTDKLQSASTHPGDSIRYLTIATINAKGTPQQRTVVMRAFDNSSLTLTFFTDSRSAKVEELKLNPFVNLHGYDHSEKVQLRLTGISSLHINDAVSDELWKKEGQKAAASYTSKLAPGTLINDKNASFSWLSDEHFFCVVRVKLTQLEFLQLNGETHLRGKRVIDSGQTTDSWLVP
jgi:pyridoxine/pyridoxamine 5'-phosphate oxidase